MKGAEASIPHVHFYGDVICGKTWRIRKQCLKKRAEKRPA
jgi:hypothetical protein